jgi:hypothetical protein
MRRSRGGDSKQGKVARGTHGGSDIGTMAVVAAVFLLLKVEGDPMGQNGPQDRKMLDLNG